MTFQYEDHRIFTTDEDGTLLGEIVFPSIPDESKMVVVERTFVNPIMRGQGLAGKLVAEFHEYAQRQHLQVKLLCPYAKRAFEQHPEYQNVLVNS